MCFSGISRLLVIFDEQSKTAPLEKSHILTALFFLQGGIMTKTDGVDAITSAYASGKITRAQFLNRFAAWQKSRGYDFTCKGYATRQGAYITYRHFLAYIENGALHFIGGAYTDKYGHRQYTHAAAKSTFEFRRAVDTELNRGRSVWQ